MTTKLLNEDGNPIMDQDPVPEPRQQIAMQNGNTAVAFAPQHLGAIAGAAQQILSGLMAEVAKGTLSMETAGFLKKMWEEERTYESEMAFNEAMSLAKAEMPLIKKTKHVGFKSKKEGVKDTSYNHEDLADVTRITDPVLGKYGLVSTFRVTNLINQPISVTCIVKHRLGFKDDSNTLMAGKDDSGNKNTIQQVGSTITYLKRYTLMAALGLAAEDDDDDGLGSESEETLSPKQVQEIKTQLANAGGNLEKFLRSLGFDSLEEVPSGRYKHVLGMIADGVKTREKLAAEQKAREEQEEVNKLKDGFTKAKPVTMA